jgi:hypothetical protein
MLHCLSLGTDSVWQSPVFTPANLLGERLTTEDAHAIPRVTNSPTPHASNPCPHPQQHGLYSLQTSSKSTKLFATLRLYM